MSRASDSDLRNTHRDLFGPYWVACERSTVSNNRSPLGASQRCCSWPWRTTSFPRPGCIRRTNGHARPLVGELRSRESHLHLLRRTDTVPRGSSEPSVHGHRTRPAFQQVPLHLHIPRSLRGARRPNHRMTQRQRRSHACHDRLVPPRHAALAEKGCQLAAIYGGFGCSPRACCDDIPPETGWTECSTHGG